MLSIESTFFPRVISMRLLYAILLLVLTAPMAFSADPKTPSWPQFRGPDGQGHVSADIPLAWSASKNKIWETAIPGKGWSSPVIADGKVWLTSALSGASKKDGTTLRAIAVDQQSGEIVHNVELFAVAKPVSLHARNSLATPSPIVAKGRLYAHFGSDGVACVETATGKVLWKNDSLKLDYETGPASSPVLYKDLLIIPCDGSDLQYAVALKTENGEIAWKTERPVAADLAKSSRRAFATPLIITVEGRDQVVMPGSHCVYSYDPATGAELWRVKYTGFSNVPRPVFADGLVYVTSGFAPPEMLAIRPDGKGDVTKTHVAWRYRKNVPNIPSPLVVGNHLYMISDKGTITSLDAKSGKEQWSERLTGNFSASPLAKGNAIYAFGDDGATVVFEAGDRFKEIARNQLPGHVQATPAASDDALFIRTDDKLFKIATTK
jgi:outer membrane protein assembly factor BamB